MGRGGMGERDGGKWRSGSPWCGNRTCIHHRRDGMGSGETCARLEENQVGQEDRGASVI